jgi:hypothetical protein
MDKYAPGRKGGAACGPNLFDKVSKVLSRAEKDEGYFLSVGYLVCTQAFQPPLRAKTFGKPILISSCATLALVPSPSQAQ